MILVDSNVLLDVLTEDSAWSEWSAGALAECADTESLAINPIVYAEVSIRFERIEELEEALPVAAERAARRSPTSTSARTPPCRAFDSSRGILPATALTFRASHWWPLDNEM